MAATNKVRTGPRIFLMMLLVLALAFGGLLWFDYLGFIDAKNTLEPVLSRLTKRRRAKIDDIEAETLLDEQRTAKQWEALEIRTQELEKREEDIGIQELEVTEMIETLQEREKALEEKEKSFNVRVNLYDNKKANIRQNSMYLTGMPPEDAVNILVQMEDQDAIDHLRATEELAQEAGQDSVVSYWLALISREDAEKAARLQRKMALKPSDTTS
jgi:flagellar protein FlbB